MSETIKKIDGYILSVPDWQRENLVKFRELLHEVEPHIQEDWKWAVPVFLLDGKLVCAMSTFKNHTKFNFFHGAALNDEYGLFNNGLDSKEHRSIDMQEGQELNRVAFRELVLEALAVAKKEK